MNATAKVLIRADETAVGLRFPASYIAARIALAKCDRIDECKDWADKAAAIASYAAQSRDNRLHEMAERIKARAVRRLGELLQQIPERRGKTTDAVRETTRTAIAAAAGLSVHQRITATRLASVPAAEFERRIESEKPATVTELADSGRARRCGRPKGGAIGSLRLALEKAEVVAHEHAAGLSVALANVAELRRRLATYVAKHGRQHEGALT